MTLLYRAYSRILVSADCVLCRPLWRVLSSYRSLDTCWRCRLQTQLTPLWYIIHTVCASANYFCELVRRLCCSLLNSLAVFIANVSSESPCRPSRSFIWSWKNIDLLFISATRGSVRKFVQQQVDVPVWMWRSPLDHLRKATTHNLQISEEVLSHIDTRQDRNSSWSFSDNNHYAIDTMLFRWSNQSFVTKILARDKKWHRINNPYESS